MKKNNRRYGKILWITACSLFLILILSVSFGGMNSYAYENTVGVVNEGDAIIRSSASTGSTALASVVAGDKVEICGVETAADGYTWYKVYVNGSTIGYIRADRLTDTGEKTGGVTDNNATGTVGQGQTSSQDTPDQTGEEGTPEVPENPGNGTQEGSTGQNTVGTGVADTSDATLYAFGISNGTMTPAFSPDITEYTISLDENITSIAAFGVPTANQAGASVIENYGFSNLQKGSNMAVITVQAADGTTKSYYFTINRGEATEEIHYSEQTPISGETAGDQEKTDQDSAKGSSHSGLIVFLIIVILAMAAVLVLMGLRIRDYRRELYGEDPEEFHLADAIPENSVFRKKVSGFSKTGGSREKRAASAPVQRKDRQEDVQDQEDALNDDDTVENGFLYDMRKAASDATQIQDPGMQYGNPDTAISYEEQETAAFEYDDADEDEEALEDTAENEDSGFDPEDDELEDIMERNATITDNENGKEVWKSVNFMTPAEDLEFEFLDLEDENE